MLFARYLHEASLTSAELQKQLELFMTIKALLKTKKLTSAQEQQAQRTLATADIPTLTKLLKQLEKFPSVPTPESTQRYNKFLALWKARPVYGPRYQRAGEPTDQSVKRYAQEVATYFRAHFGGRAVWTDAFLQRYLGAAFDESPKITYKGKRYALANGMDERDFVWDVINDNHITL